MDKRIRPVLHKANWIRCSALALLSLTVLSGCAFNSNDAIPQGRYTMMQAYEHAYGERNGSVKTNDEVFLSSGAVVNHPMKNASINTFSGGGYMRTGFKLLPNPSIPIYIYPHLARFNGTVTPVPGMTTSFFMYKRNHYALSYQDY